MYLYLYEPVGPKQIGFGSVHLIHLVKVTDKWRVFVNTVLNFRDPMCREFIDCPNDLSASE